MGWLKKIAKRVTRWTKAIHLGNTIEALIKGGNVWKAFWKDKSIIYGEVFRLIDDFFPSYETFYDNQTVGIFKDPFKCNTLTNVVAGSIFSHTDLQDMMRDASLNGLVNRANSYCKRAKKSELYKSFEGAIYYDSPDEDETAMWLSSILGIPLFEEENTPETYIEIMPATYEESDLVSIAHEYLRANYGYDGSFLTYNEDSYFIENAVTTDNNTNIKLTIISKTNISAGATSYEKVKRDYLNIPITVYDGKYCCIKFICGTGDTLNYVSEYWIALNDPNCPGFIKNTFEKQKSKSSEYLMPLRLRSDYKAIQQDAAEFKENEKLFKILGIDFVDIARCINADVSILDRRTVKNRREKDKAQQEADVNYIANLEKVNNAFLFFGLELSEDSQEANEYFFKYFKWLDNVNESGSEEINYKEYGYRLTFDGINVTTEKNASKAEYPTKYGKRLIKESTYEYYLSNGKTQQRKKSVDSLLIWHWLDSKNVEKVVITNLGSYNYNSGWRGVSLADGLNVASDDDKGNFYIPINMAVLRRLGPFKGADVFKASIRVVFNSSTKIRKKWYATTWFTVVRVIASIVIIICTWGAGTPLVVCANVAAQIAINIAIQILITIAIRLAVKYICKIFNIPAEYAGVISMAVNMAVSMYTGGLSTGADGASIAGMAGPTAIGMAIGNTIADSAVDGKRITLNSIADNLGAAAAAMAGGAIMGYAGAPASIVGKAVYGAAQAVVTSAISMALSSSFYEMLQTGDLDQLYQTGAMAAIGGAISGAASYRPQDSQVKQIPFHGTASQQLYTEKVMYTPIGTANSNNTGISVTQGLSMASSIWSAYNQRQINKKYQKIQDAMKSLNAKQEELKALMKSVDDMKSKVTPEILKAYSHDFTDIVIDNKNDYTFIRDFDIVLAHIHNLPNIILSKGRSKNNNSPILQATYFNA